MRQAGTIPPLISGGLMLSYRCTNSCRHCLYRCSPRQPNEWMTPAMLDRICRALALEAELQGLHIAGGEPMLRMDLVTQVVRQLREHGLPVAYVETNAFWCDDGASTRRRLEELRAAGLPALLVSVSMFHNEFVPFARTRTCVEVAREVFGVGNVLLYLPHMYDLLAQFPDDGTHTLAEFQRLTGLEQRPELIPELYQVIAAGRAPEGLGECYARYPAERFAGEDCAGDLRNTQHFHIDHRGNLFTGLCAGLAPADVADLHPRITAASHPVFTRLCAEGPFGLMEWARVEHGYTLPRGGFVSKCDLCFQVRRHLQRGGGFPELRPVSFYD